MRWFIAALMITTAAAQAQTPVRVAAAASPPASPAASVEQTAPLSGSPAAPPERPHRARRTLQVRFDEANTTHDGHLTAEQARAKMPSVARDFAAIDTDNKGYVTLDQIKAHSRAVRAAKRAAKEQQ